MEKFYSETLIYNGYYLHYDVDWSTAYSYIQGFI